MGAAMSLGGLHPTEIGDAVHRLLELVDLRSPAAPEASVELELLVAAGTRACRPEEIVRIGELVPVVHRLGARARASPGSAASGPSGRSRSSSTRCSSTGASMSSGSRASGRSCSTTRPMRCSAAIRRRSSRRST